MTADLRAQVYEVVRLVPRGRVVSYGDIAGMFGINPRQVGRFLATSEPSEELPWWRVTNASGVLPKHLLDEARACWLEEGIALSAGRRGCCINSSRADLGDLADAAEERLGPLPGVSGPAADPGPEPD